MQFPRGIPPIELIGSLSILLTPEDPGREDAIEKRLHERRTEEVFALLAFELQTECFFQSRTNGIERGQFRFFNPRFRVARV